MTTIPQILVLKPQKDYELIDSGEGEKLERFGEVITIRPDPQALWEKTKPEKWAEAHVVYERTGPKTGAWKGKNLPESWPIELSGIKFNIHLSSFKHTGVFPEQALNWEWLSEKISISNFQFTKDEPMQVLNLFGYTGGASLICAKAGAKVTHVDSSKTAIDWANLNAKSSKLEATSIRWILEDAFSFVKKEIRRGKKYEGIIMDPPTFGHGTKGEIWKIEKQFTDLVNDCSKLLSDKPVFFLINGYAAGYSSITYANNLLQIQNKYGGEIQHGELAIEESVGKRLMPAGIFARLSF